MRYKTLLLDVDGVVVPVGPNIVPSNKVVHALKQAKNKLSVSFVSGRPFNWLVGLFRLLELKDPCIINGGAQIVNPGTGSIIWEQPLNKKDIEKILEIIRNDSTSFLVNDGGIESRDPVNLKFTNPIAIQISYLDSEKKDEYLEILHTMPDIEAREFFSWQSNKTDIYITHREASKFHAVKILADLLDIHPSEIIGVGDGLNDIPFLNACGLKIAMGNAADELKKMADFVAPSVEEDGVAHFIEKFILTN